jgi:hypothetical protein
VIDTDRTTGNYRSRDTLSVDHLFITVENFGPPTAPNAPGSLAAASGGQTSIDISWADNSNNEDGFLVEGSADGAGWAPIASVGSNVTSYSETGLDPSTTRHYRVRAYNAVGNSAYSNTASATTDEYVPPNPPTAPTGLTATAAGSSSIALAWTDTADNENGFFIQRSTDGTSFATVASVGANTVSYTNTGLTANTLYYYQLYAYNGDGDSGLSNIDSATTDMAPNITLDLAGSKYRGKHVVDLTWSGADGGVANTVDIRRDGGLLVNTANDGSYTDSTGNNGGRTYRYQVCESGSTTMCSAEQSITF